MSLQAETKGGNDGFSFQFAKEGLYVHVVFLKTKIKRKSLRCASILGVDLAKVQVRSKVGIVMPICRAQRLPGRGSKSIFDEKPVCRYMEGCLGVSERCVRMGCRGVLCVACASGVRVSVDVLQWV